LILQRGISEKRAAWFRPQQRKAILAFLALTWINKWRARWVQLLICIKASGGTIAHAIEPLCPWLENIRLKDIYVMCEIPNNVVQTDAFAQLFDGFSIGAAI
jgi:hypothetical protein